VFHFSHLNSSPSTSPSPHHQGNTALELCALHSDLDTALLLHKFSGEGRELSPQVNVKEALSPLSGAPHRKELLDEEQLDLPILEVDSEYVMDEMEEGIHRSAANALHDFRLAEEPLAGRLQQYL
jgi:hypothetical protein